MVVELREAPLRGASSRTMITSLAQLDHELASWYEQDFALDLETSGLDSMIDEVVGIAITLADERSYYIVLKHTVEDEEDGRVTGTSLRVFCPSALVWQRLTEFFAHEDVTFVAHNLKFELHFLKKAGVDIQCRLADTMLAAHLIDENRSMGLKSLSSLVGVEMTPYKDLEHYPGFTKDQILGVPLEKVAHYAMDDSSATWKLWQLFQEQMETEGVRGAFNEIWMPCLVTLQEMEAKGIAIDMEKVEEARLHYEARAEVAHIAIWQAGIAMVLDRVRRSEDWTRLPPAVLKPVVELGDLAQDCTEDTVTLHGVELPILRKERASFRPRVPWFNPASTAQISQLLYEWHGLTVPDDIEVERNKDGKLGVDKDTLKVMAYALGRDAPAVLGHLLEFRQCEKVLSTYLETYAARCDRRDHYALHTTFNQASTDTGRLSSSGPNLQNQPARGEAGRTIRSLFISRPGYQLVVADYSMMELRLAAHFSEDPVMTQAFQDGLDLHALTAAQQQNLTYDTFIERLENGDPACKAARQIGKTSNFGLLYGMGAKKFQRFLLTENGVKLPLSDVSGLINSFERTYAGIQKWKRWVSRSLVRMGHVETIGGRRRRLPEVYHDNETQQSLAHRRAVNATIQGSCADIINGVIPTLQKRLGLMGGYLLLQVHDELVAEVPERYAALCAQTMESVMADPNRRYALTVPLVAEAGIGDSWWSAKAA